MFGQYASKLLNYLRQYFLDKLYIKQFHNYSLFHEVWDTNPFYRDNHQCHVGHTRVIDITSSFVK
jgi:hypothetical protein